MILIVALCLCGMLTGKKFWCMYSYIFVYTNMMSDFDCGLVFVWDKKSEDVVVCIYISLYVHAR